MSITFGSARIDENGNISGGRAGDQTGSEVSMQGYYMHSQGWYCLRPKSASVANMIAQAMIDACNNDYIGYDQSNRNVVSVVKYYGSMSAIREYCETDCANLVRGCIWEATGRDIGDFYTGNEASVLENSGLFEKRFSVSSSSQLYNGDVLVTKSKGHTVIVVSGRPRSGSSSSGSSSSGGSSSGNTSYCGQGIGTGVCTADGVRIRTGAGTNYTILGSVNTGTAVEVLAKVGDWYKIVWPGASVGYAYTSAQYYTYTASNSSSSTPGSSTSITGESYTVQKGDTLSEIAQAMGVSTSELAAYNNISNPNNISVGQVIKNPKYTSDDYTVQKGDTLSEIAQKWGVSTSELAAYNGIANPNNIYVGQVIHKPSSSSSSGSSSSGGSSSSNSSNVSLVKAGQTHANNFVGAGLDVDGSRGTETKKAGIKCLQSALNLDFDEGLAVDGSWGSKTDAAVRRHSVKYGDNCYTVTALQILLLLKAYNPNGVESPGSFGNGCKAAVESYQSNNGLEKDGIAGYNTFKSLCN